MTDSSPDEKTQGEKIQTIGPPTGDLTQLAGDYSHPARRPRVWLPLFLFLATCLATFWTGSCGWLPDDPVEALSSPSGILARIDWQQGLIYMASVMGILLAHEMGHFIVARRHGIPASLPFFIPMPVLPFGTMGAVIGMQGSKADRRQLFDLGIAGPLAGLAVAIPITWYGVLQLHDLPSASGYLKFPSPLLLRAMIGLIHDTLPADFDPTVLDISQFNPYLMAGWVGMLVTSLNMVPVSQLDGGHVSYALFTRHANSLARGLLIAAIIFIVVAAQYIWVLMLVIVIIIGINHPPTADDHVNLGWPRCILGWAALTIPILCLPPIRMPH